MTPTLARTLQAIAAVTAIAAMATDSAAETLQAGTVRAWHTYVAATEMRIGRELNAPGRFLVADHASDAAATRDALARGTITVAKSTTSGTDGRAIAVPDGLIQHWRGAVLLPGASLDALLNRLQHPNERGPHQQDVVALRVIARQPNRLKLAIRMTRTKIVTVTYDTEHTIEYRIHGSGRASSRSVSTRIVEIEDAGTAAERALPEGQDRGFLWRMNSYWRYEQVAGGVIVELESVTLSRNIPLGLGVIVEPIIDRIARESINRTLENLRRTYAQRDPVRSAGLY
jgi:hypothetical protein